MLLMRMNLKNYWHVITPNALRRLGCLFFCFTLLGSLAGCATRPSNINNICHMFEQKRGWYKSAKATEKKWNVPVFVTMAFIHQESRFRAKAAPPRKKILWIIPGPRPSSAYGYAQALDGTWNQYRKSTGNRGGDRDDFDDAADFIGWYNNKSYRKNKIKRGDAYNLYLAYHEGHGGYARATYKRKPWLIKVSKKVQKRSRRYQQQYGSCQKELEKGWVRRLFS